MSAQTVALKDSKSSGILPRVCVAPQESVGVARVGSPLERLSASLPVSRCGTDVSSARL